MMDNRNTIDNTINEVTRAARAGRRYGGDLFKIGSLWVRQGRRVDPKTLLIFGCQRSGTTALQQVFAADRNVVSFGELGLAFERWPYNHRLRDEKTVRRMIGLTAASMVVIKPLVESHRVVDLLDRLPESRAIWMYRHYADVASSNLKRFGSDNGRSNVARALSGDPRDWRAQGLGDHEIEVMSGFDFESLGHHDFAALFWWLRNRLFVGQHLVDEQRLRMCSYRDLVTEPQETIDAMYELAGVEPLRPGAGGLIHRSSIDKGRNIELDPQVQGLCETMWRLLEKSNDDYGLRHRRT